MENFNAPTTELMNLVDTELNASLAQLVRAVNGIAMPEYYNEYDPDYGDNLNLYGNDYNAPERSAGSGRQTVKGVPFGSIEYVVRQLVSEDAGLMNDFRELGEPEFLGMVREINKVRQGSAHTIVISREEFLWTFTLVSTMFKEYIGPIYELKEWLKHPA